MRPRTAALAAAGLLLAPAPADAHSTVTVARGEIVYASEDAVSDNALAVTEDATEIVFSDPEADAGIQSSDARCRPTRARGATVIEVRCRRVGLSRLSVYLGPNEDTVHVTLGDQWQIVDVAGGPGRDAITLAGPPPGILSGDQGADTVTGGDGDDSIAGGEGDDRLAGGAGRDALQGGTGLDVVDGGEGDDELTGADGLADELRCGGGSDRAVADTADAVAADCETAERSHVDPPPSSGGTGGDRIRPRVRVGGPTVQRVSRRRPFIRLAVTSSERGSVAASGFLEAGGLNLPLQSREHPIDAAGAGVWLRVRLSRGAIRRVRRDLERGRRPVARLRVAAGDEAGNTAVSKRFTVRLRR